MDPSTSMADAQTPECQDNLEGPVTMERHQSITSEELPPVIPKYYSVMEDECPDEVFTSLPSRPSRLEPEEGSTCAAAATDPSASPRSFDGTETKANPECLDWTHEEKQSMTSRTQGSKKMEGVLATFEEVIKSDSSSGIQCVGQDQEILEDQFKIPKSGHSTEEEVVECNDEGKDPTWNEQVKSLDDTDLRDDIRLKNQNTESLNPASQDEMEDNHTSPDISQEEGIDRKLEGVLDNELTGYDWVRRTGVEDDAEGLSSEHRGRDGQEESAGTVSDSRIATEILQGANLLQRLQLLQQRQDEEEICSQTPKLEEDVMTKVNVASETIQDIQQEEDLSPVSTVTAQFEGCRIHQTESDSGHFVNLKVTSADEYVYKQLEQDGPESQSIEDGGHMDDETVDEEHICEKEKNDSDNEGDEQEAKERISLTTLSPQQTVDRGLFDLTENPDVLEIPFKTNISLESQPMSEDPSPRGDWHFSEQRMQKEISQEMQRELVLVNLGKIPGGYSKGESRQMRDTKLLFEAFQHEKMEGPTRFRKPLASLPKGQVYPSVLERTRSLEMFSQKMSPMFRTHSFRLVSNSEKEKYPETFRPLSPSVRDKTRLSPYPKHEKHTRMHKSMDSINMNSPTAAGVRSSKQEPSREGSPLLMENPFFKLRPALSLQPEVEKDIREAKNREEELRKQRSSLYGDTRAGRKDKGWKTADLKTDPTTQKATGRLERVWPPPSKKDPTKPEQQEAKVQRGPGNKTTLWQRWESGLINGQSPATTNNN